MAKTRGVFEKQAGSGIWWIQYYTEGKRHREKVGRKSDAIKLYQKRKADAHAGVKLPTLRGAHGVFMGELVDDAMKVVAEHKSERSYRSRGRIVGMAWGSRVAASIMPQELDTWLQNHCQTPASINRYRAFFSLCYREGIKNGKVSVNPARLVRHRKEPRGRLRFLSRDEYRTLLTIIPEPHLAEFIVSVHTGMRLSEQYTATWRQFFSHRRLIELWDTKNDEPRIIHLNQAAFDAIQSIKLTKPDSAARIFPHTRKYFSNDSWFLPSLRAANVDNYTWHNNRHTFCSWLAMAGASIREIMEAAGHKSIAMAARYSHLSPAHTSAVVDRLVDSKLGQLFSK